MFAPRQILAALLLALVPLLVHAQPLPPGNVHALVYSVTAAELFWQPSPGARVSIRRNGEELGLLDARSRFFSDLNPDTPYRFELRSIDQAGSQSAPVVINVDTRGFTPPIRRVEPDSSVSSDQAVLVAPEPEAMDPMLGAEPAAPDSTLAVETPPPSDIARRTDGCSVASIQDLVACGQRANDFDVISVQQDLECRGGDCCPGGQALLRLRGVDRLEIFGNGHRLLRTDGQRRCSLIDIEQGRDISVHDWHLDEDNRDPGCQVQENCPRALHIKRSNNIALERVQLSHAKGYAIYVQGVDGFRFDNSILHNSGVLGLYIGHGNESSRNVRVTNSRFIDNQTNGLALLGVVGENSGSNQVTDNLFLRNHRLGQWPVAPQFGTGLTGGGQVYLASVRQLTFARNLIADGYCSNCFVQRRARSGVTGLELGLPGRQSVSDVLIADNVISNVDGFGIGVNSNSPVTGNVRISNNRISNATTGIKDSGAALSGNQISDTQLFDSFESGSDLGSRFTSNTQCSSSASVSRQCGGDSRFGQCRVDVSLGAADCDDAVAELRGPSVSVSAGSTVHASAWVTTTHGEWCIEFLDGGANPVSSQCVDLGSANSSSVQGFVGTPLLSAVAPGNASNARVRLSNRRPDTRLGIDDIKLSVAR